jgi:trimethylamine-N-oxide reductase (cytochrome c)
MLLRPVTEVIKTETVTVTGSQEVLMTSAHDMGPFIAHVRDGRWVRSSPLKPNLTVGHNVFTVRSRVFAPDRIRYPMKRVGWAPGGTSSTANRGKGEFVRISWQEALDLTAQETKRIIDKYGPSAIYVRNPWHPWTGRLHRGQAIVDNLFNLLGGHTFRVGGTSSVAWQDASPLSWGERSYAANNYADILQNCKLMIYWAVDPLRSRGCYSDSKVNTWRWKLKEAGIKSVFIDVWLTDTAALHGDQFIPIIPGTDEAVMAAIVHVWITENLYNKEYVETHTVGFDKFEDYVLGKEDGIAKTPAWAESVSNVPAATITALAREWASKPTHIVASTGGANRREWCGQWVRMLITLQAMLGYLGKPGCGLGGEPGLPAVVGMRSPGQGPPPSVANKVGQSIQHVQFPQAILNPPITWTSGAMSGPSTGEGSSYGGKGAKPVKLSYPMPGYSEVKMIYSCQASDSNMIPGTERYHEAYQSPKLEFIAVQQAWWQALPVFADIVMPVNHIGERDDIITWQNYTVFAHKLIEPLYESKTDLEVAKALADRLGVADQLMQGKTEEDWLKQIYSAGNVPLSYEDFKKFGYYEYKFEEQQPVVSPVLKAFLDDPEKNPLSTPSGKIEIYSQRMADFWGPNDPTAPPIPKYIEPTESRNSPLAKKYPLLWMNGGSKFGRHSQWNNVASLRDEQQLYINGYQAILINPKDAEARGVKHGNVVRVFNDRGQILCGAKVTERMQPGIVWVYQGGHFKSAEPGKIGALDLGGNVNVLCMPKQAEPICDGMIAHSGLVEVEKWEG